MYTGKTLGAEGNTNGHYFSASSGNVFQDATAKDSSAVVDFLYYNEGSATLAAPYNNAAQNVYNTPPFAIASWTFKNDTRFKLGQAADYALDTNSGIAAAYNENTTGGANRISSLAQGDVVLFKTGAGKYGVLQITQISLSPTPDAGFIRFNVKAQH